MRIATVVLVALLAALAAGCGGDDGDGGQAASDETTADPATSETTAADDAGAGAGDADVVAEEISFNPNSANVAAGETVTWENRDEVAHTVTAGTPDDPGSAFDEPLPTGGTVEHTFDEPGTYAYFCEIHPTMTAEIVVS